MSAPISDADISPGFRDNCSAPIIYFDGAATHGVLNGAIEVELVTRILIPLANGGVRPEMVITGRLRCSPVAAQSLQDSITKALAMLSLPQLASPRRDQLAGFATFQTAPLPA